MSASKSDKPPRIKGLVKRCRSFKEDILSRLARNRSLGQEGQSGACSPGVASPTGWNSEGEPLLPGDNPSLEPRVSICHRLKEAHLTLQFVESLIQKNCIDLLGGSSNVMLDLMGCLLNDVKKASASDSAAYQSAISQVKAALSEFLTSVDVLLLKEECDEAQKELYFEKLLETLKTTREALMRLKNLVDAKENGHSTKLSIATTAPAKRGSVGGGGRVCSPAGVVHSDTTAFANILSQSNTEDKRKDGASGKVQEKRPPLPPKLKQWTAKSFDTIDWSGGGSGGVHSQNSRNSSQSQLYPLRGSITTGYSSQTPSSTNSNSMLNQWLEQQSGPSSPIQHQNITSCSTSQLSPRQQHQQQSSATSSHGTHHPEGMGASNSSSSGSLLHHNQFQHHHQTVYQQQRHHHSSKFYELSSSSQHSHSQNWIDSSIYVARSSATNSSNSTSGSGLPPSKILIGQINGKKTRTFSDSYRLGSDDSLDKMLLVDESRSQSAATTHSQSLSLGSSLDNLLLVDAQSTQSGLSPNSACEGRNSGCASGAGGANTQRISVSSCNTSSGAGLAGLSMYDPDTDTDADVFATCAEPPLRSRDNNSLSIFHPGHPEGLTNHGAGIVISGEAAPTAVFSEGEPSASSPPPMLPEKQSRIRKFLLGSPTRRVPPPPTLGLPDSSDINQFQRQISNNNPAVPSIDSGSGGLGSCNNNSSMVESHSASTGLMDPRSPSPYDNVREGEDIDVASWHGTTSLSPMPGNAEMFPPRPSVGALSTSSANSYHSRQFMSCSESRNTLVGAASGYEQEEKPPLPPKKKHSLITAYVELMHNFDSHAYHHHHQHQQHHHHFHNHQNSFHFTHHSDGHTPLFHQYSLQTPLQTSSFPFSNNQQPDLSPQSAGGGASNNIAEFKRSSFANPAISPFHHYPQQSFCTSPSSLGGQSNGGQGIPPPVSPASEDHYQLVDNQSLRNSLSPSPSCEGRAMGGGGSGFSQGKPPSLPPKKCRAAFATNTPNSEDNTGNRSSHVCGDNSDQHHPQSPQQQQPHVQGPEATSSHFLSPSGAQRPPSPKSFNTLNIPISVNVSNVTAPALTPAHSFSGADSISLGSPQRGLDEDNVEMYILDAGPLLVMNDGSTSIGKPSCDGPEVKGGDPHALIVYSTSPNLADKKFREVFLLTYRNFVRPIDVVSLLWKRYQYFEKKTDRTSVTHARATLDVFVDVVNSLTPMDLEQGMVTKVRDCIYYLVNNGEIINALKARKGLIVKYSVRTKLLSPKPAPVSLAITTEGQTLLQWSATSIAQQMTLLDAELFRQLEPAELLLWAREQTEDLCPALNNFTEHFNKVSYWARSKVLTCVTSRERNRTMKKLIEVMRKLRDYSNFNSLLAVLAALDSAPIRRLGFSRRLTEALKPHAALTDSSGSFRTYRQALAESKLPCIPYIGLVLQDLTFVHIGNVDFLADGKVNWIKRWQQWVVLEPIRRFHSCQFGFIRNDSLLAFLNNFDESLNDDDLWQLSEQIKPRCKN